MTGSAYHRYNSLENPIGIETSRRWLDALCDGRYNSLENPIGIETLTRGSSTTPTLGSYNSLENPIGIETLLAKLAGSPMEIVTTH